MVNDLKFIEAELPSGYQRLPFIELQGNGTFKWLFPTSRLGNPYDFSLNKTNELVCSGPFNYNW